MVRVGQMALQISKDAKARGKAASGQVSWRSLWAAADRKARMRWFPKTSLAGNGPLVKKMTFVGEGDRKADLNDLLFRDMSCRVGAHGWTSSI